MNQRPFEPRFFVPSSEGSHGPGGDVSGTAMIALVPGRAECFTSCFTFGCLDAWRIIWLGGVTACGLTDPPEVITAVRTKVTPIATRIMLEATACVRPNASFPTGFAMSLSCNRLGIRS